MDSINNRKLILSGLILLALAGGLFVALSLVQKNTTIKSRADTNLVNLEIIFPKQSTKVLGITQVRATANTTVSVENLSSVMQTDGGSGQPLEVQSSEIGKVVISGQWDTSSLSLGEHILEIFLYDKTTGELNLVGSSRVSVTVVPP